ncbi:MAG: histidinol-phosphatase [Treponema sp.]|nr:histidinol-phosphatase [Treponema sp.]
MSLACIHVHTSFCDGQDDVETCCRSAYQKGLASLGFSAHAPVEKKTGIKSSWNLLEKDLEPYLQEVRKAQKRWKDKLIIFLGLEVDYISGLMGPADRDYHEMGLDYIIAGVHYLVPPRGPPFTVDNSREKVEQGLKEGYGGDALAMTGAYYAALGDLINSGGFDLLVHPDLVKKNNGGNYFFSEEDEGYIRQRSAIPPLLAQEGIPAEVNTGGMIRQKIHDCYPSAPFLRQFRECSVPMVINSDAHKAEDLDGYYNEAIRAMTEAGYTETLIFGGREEGRPLWRPITLGSP